MWQGRVSQNVREVAFELAALGGFRYPPFVYGGPLRRGEVPVFCLHVVDEEPFAQQLAHIKRNGYTALDADELHEVLTGHRRPPERAVALTFDDGDRSVWTVAIPLLKRFGLRATLFVVPGRTPDLPLVRWTLDDVWSGACTREALAQAVKDSPPLMTWQEIETAHRTGIVSIQSHSLSHALVFTAPKVVDFVSPQLLAGLHPHEIPLLRLNGADALIGDPPAGTPLYRSSPTLAARVRYVESPEVRRACVEHVSKHGGVRFFERPGWRGELSRIEAVSRKRDKGGPRYEVGAARLSAVRRELVESKRAIEARLAGHTVRHFCHPWGYALPEVATIAREAGYATSFWGDAPGSLRRAAARVGDDPYRMSRLGAIWIRALPGSRRIGLAAMLVAKTRRRLRQGSAYLTHT